MEPGSRKWEARVETNCNSSFVESASVETKIFSSQKVKSRDVLSKRLKNLK